MLGIVAGFTRNEFIKDSAYVFRCKTKPSDCHKNMNTENYMQFFKDHILTNKNLPPKCLIIQEDNAGYHLTKVRQFKKLKQ